MDGVISSMDKGRYCPWIIRGAHLSNTALSTTDHLHPWIQVIHRGCKSNGGSINMSESSNHSTHSHSSSCSSLPLHCADSQPNAPDIPVSILLGESETSPLSSPVSLHEGSSHPYNDSEYSHSSTKIDQTGLELSVDDPPDQIECLDSPQLEVYFAPTPLQGIDDSNDSIPENQVLVQAISSVLDSSSPVQEPRDEAGDANEIQLNTESQPSPPEDTIEKHSSLEDKELSSDLRSLLELPFSSLEESTHGTVTHKVHERHSSSGSFPKQNLTSSTPYGTSKNEESPLITPRRRFALAKSAAQEEWEIQKNYENDEGEGVCESESIDALMELVGLEAVKAQFLAIKAKIDMFNDQQVDLKAERFNVIFQGSPGTGKRGTKSKLHIVQETHNIFHRQDDHCSSICKFYARSWSDIF